jgi:hypothetical protein
MGFLVPVLSGWSWLLLHLFMVPGDGNDMTNIGLSAELPEGPFRDVRGAAGASFVLPKGVLTLSTLMSDLLAAGTLLCLSGVGVVLIVDHQCTLGRVRPSRRGCGRYALSVRHHDRKIINHIQIPDLGQTRCLAAALKVNVADIAGRAEAVEAAETRACRAEA